MKKAKKIKKAKTKELRLQMKFNPGTLRYEPVLPVKNPENIKRKWTRKKF